MTIYGNYLDNADKKELLETIDSLCMVIDHLQTVSESDEYLDEGANINMTVEYKDLKVKLHSISKEYRKALRKKDYKECLSKLDEMDKALGDCENAIRSIDGGKAGSVILGYFAGFITNSLEILIPVKIGNLSAKAAAKLGAESIAQSIGSATSWYNIIASIAQLIKRFIVFKDELKNADTSTGEAFNKYRNSLLRFIGDSRKSVKDCRKTIDKLYKKQQAKESK